MDDYVSREAALETLRTVFDTEAWDCTDGGHLIRYEDSVCAITDIPVADVRPVVLCRDCRNCGKVDDWEYWCFGLGSPARLVTPEDWCSKGKKRQEVRG